MIYDDALVAFLGAVPRGKQCVDSSEFGRHGILSTDLNWQADTETIRRSYLPFGTYLGEYATASFTAISLDAFSVAAWVRLHTLSSGLRTILFGGLTGETWSNTSRWWFHFNASNLLFRSANDPQITVASGIAVNTWAHVGVSRASDGAVRIYRNGTLIKTGMLDRTMTMPAVTVGYQQQYKAGVDVADAAVWGRELSGDEFVKLANPRFFPLGTNRVGFPLSRILN